MISAVLLGAGESKRMKVNKLILPWGKKKVLEHCVDTLLRSKIKELIVVLSDRSKEMRSQLEKKSVFVGKKLKVVMNPHYKKGMSTSIRRGIKVVDSNSHGILIALGDQPFIKTRTINALIQAFKKGRGGITIPSFQGRRGHPVIFDRKYVKDLLKLKGDIGGRSIIQRYPKSVVEVQVKSEGVVKDIDTWQDYKKWLRMKKGILDWERGEGRFAK